MATPSSNIFTFKAGEGATDLASHYSSKAVFPTSALVSLELIFLLQNGKKPVKDPI